VAESRLVKTTALTGLRPLGLHGQPAIDSYRQIRAMLEGRLGREHASLFARPERRGDGGIDWFTEAAGPVRSLEELTPEERSRAETDLTRKLADVAALAEDLRGGASEAARHLGELLQAAVQTAGAHCRLVAGERPILILWGFAPAEAVPDLPPRRVRVPDPAPPQRADAVASGPVLASAALVPATARDWWRWLLLAALLLVALLLALRACAPPPPAIADAAPAPADELRRATERGKELERRLAELQRLPRRRALQRSARERRRPGRARTRTGLCAAGQCAGDAVRRGAGRAAPRDSRASRTAPARRNAEPCARPAAASDDP
jgi:hypothetical protein